jgi:hypothetical protein|tara:strand:+ start:401 stop:577 length:177 start_codon:yes stop_codon:yes gene_type:complete
LLSLVLLTSACQLAEKSDVEVSDLNGKEENIQHYRTILSKSERVIGGHPYTKYKWLAI